MPQKDIYGLSAADVLRLKRLLEWFERRTEPGKTVLPRKKRDCRGTRNGILKEALNGLDPVRFRLLRLVDGTTEEVPLDQYCFTHLCGANADAGTRIVVGWDFQAGMWSVINADCEPCPVASSSQSAGA